MHSRHISARSKASFTSHELEFANYATYIVSQKNDIEVGHNTENKGNSPDPK